MARYDVEKINKVLAKVLKEIKPSKDEEMKLSSFTAEHIKVLNLKLEKIGAIAVLGGSGAKKTWLSGNHDLDIFVKFDYEKYKSENDDLSNILSVILESIYGKECVRVHGSRDYFQVQIDGFFMEFVPVLDITGPEDALNITDVSPMHAEWVSWMVDKSKEVKGSENKGIEDQVRLTKAFCRANNLYGAESFVLGFSGYICEILTIYYGSFFNLLESSIAWTEKDVIDPRKYYPKRAELFAKLNSEKTKSPLIIIDPVQKDRNAAAALSKEKFVQFKKLANEFLENPDYSFFVKKELTVKELKKNAGDNLLFIVSASPLEGKIDVIGSKLFKVFEFIQSNLKRNEFITADAGWQWDKKNEALFWFILDKKELSGKVKRMGPPVKHKVFFEDFKKKHGDDVVIENNRSYANLKREFTKPQQLFNWLKKDNYINTRVKDLRIVNE
ncbi:MAG: hypothetical protein Q8O89_03985 [Nanoarchaeota archaeon]|nr:hypothetical protein [Nanoarchaeota archaeon]